MNGTNLWPGLGMGFGAALPGGLRIIESKQLVDRNEDWSRVRSPSRARRRMRQGHRQNIIVTYTPKTIAYHMPHENAVVMHPDMARQLRARLQEPTR